MARQENGYIGGFSGRLGPAVGYQWRGRWYLRVRPQAVYNPRTDKQMTHRSMFKQEVQLASSMHWAVKTGLDDVARDAGMTADNLFVRINQQCFGIEDEVLTIDYSGLQLSLGPVAPVSFGQPSLDADNTLRVSFTKADADGPARSFDSVYLFAYCPDERLGYLASPVYRRTKHIELLMPDRFAGHELQLFGFVKDDAGRCSPTVYIGRVGVDDSKSPTLVQVASPLPDPEAEETAAAPETPAATAVEKARATAASPAHDPPDPMQLSLW